MAAYQKIYFGSYLRLSVVDSKSPDKYANELVANNFYEPHNGGDSMDENLLIPNDTKGLLFQFEINKDVAADYCLQDNSIDKIDMKRADAAFFEKYKDDIKILMDNGYKADICYGLIIHFA